MIEIATWCLELFPDRKDVHYIRKDAPIFGTAENSIMKTSRFNIYIYDTTFNIGWSCKKLNQRPLFSPEVKTQTGDNAGRPNSLQYKKTIIRKIEWSYAIIRLWIFWPCWSSWWHSLSLLVDQSAYYLQNVFWLWHSLWQRLENGLPFFIFVV
jgi:hypothetical protein